jgi:uncharacterized metal-binding protein YceD (DUF177 family)
LEKDLYFCKPKFEEMSGLYKVPISGLKEGHYLYDFEVGNNFFEEFEESEIKEGNLSVRVELDRRPSHFDLIIKIAGKVRICCDRCLEMFFQPIACENRLLIKFGKNWDDSDPDIIIVPADENELDIKQYLYEFIHLALPIKRIHPADGTGKDSCDPEMLKKLGQYIINENKMNDPRWDELKKLINNN